MLPRHTAAIVTSQIRRLSELRQHDSALPCTTNPAEQYLVIVSPFISVRAMPAGELAKRIAAAKAHWPALRVTMYTDT